MRFDAPELKDIAGLRDRRCEQIRFEGTLLKHVNGIAQNDLVEGEARYEHRPGSTLELGFERYPFRSAG
jgi:hypothetical protein